jgi:hypothetical protein
MSRLDYPLTYECANCDRETTVEREDLRTLHTNPQSINALEIVLQRRGWLRDDLDGLLFCPDCIGGAQSSR